MKGVSEPPKPTRKLDDVGTRLDFYQELVDIWGDGLDAVTNSLARFANDTDMARKRSLENAIYLLQKQIEQISDYDKYKLRLREEINKIPPTGWQKKPVSRLMAEKIEEEGNDNAHKDAGI